MISFILRRIASMIPVLFGVSALVFYLMSLAPGDFLTEARSRPDISDELIAQMERDYGLVDAHGEPTAWYVQYAFWLNNLSPLKFLYTGTDPEPTASADTSAESEAKAAPPPAAETLSEEKSATATEAETEPEPTYTFGLHWGKPSLGQSWAYNIPVSSLIAQRLPATFALSLCALAFAWVVAVPMGVLAAIRRNKFFDRLSSLFAYAALSVPEFFLAILMVFFAAKTGLFPAGGLSSLSSSFLPLPARWADYAYHLILPTFVLGVGGIAGMMRIMRANFLDYMQSDFVTTARAKGVSERVIMFRHVLRNAINPLLTSLGFALAGLLSGAVLVEKVMNYPGLGLLVFEAFTRKDHAVVLAAVMMGCTMLMLGNLVADLLLAWSDPRIRLESGTGGIVRKGQWKPAAILVAVVVALLTGISFIPWGNTEAMQALIGWIKWGGLVVLLAVAAFIFKVAWPTFVSIARQLLRRPVGLIAACVLGLLYFGAAFAPFLATHQASDQNLLQTFHPPTALTWDGGLAVKVYANIDPTAAKYEAVQGESIPVKFLAEGFEYKLFGFIPTSRHLLLPDYKALEQQLGEPVDPAEFPVYLLGSDSTGRDIFSRLLYGSQISLTIGLIGIGITMTIGFLVGGLAGYFGGRFDFLAMRLVEFLMAIPGLYLLLALRSALAPHFESGQMFVVIIIILSLVGWAGTARVLRGMSLSIRSRQFILAAESMGQSTGKVLLKHLLPNLASYLLVAATLSIPGYILGEAALSFLGLGIQEPSASWGLMLQQSQQDMKVFFLNFWWLLTPGAAIFITVIAFNVMGDTLRDIVDPRMRSNQ
ncbi:ABC transporter permease subunit [Ruficoccus sp. ZRK36]|uniref:ABC transporter permease subunit n=1 Tax=Ruficoccus sp. ZRK36 TaxID=2866311 RepID=UPI001C7355F5|nr:ABC transporter permease subunit [Ruficoccus sp. ZRK36]QYY34488.1 ABC transporter permease subunit [Ruficoccus sp. ZRK36]